MNGRPRTSGLGPRGTAFAVVLSCLAPSAVSADDLGECVDEAVRAMRARGARPVGEPVVAFLREGQSRSVGFQLDEAGCVGVLAVGHRRVHDIDLVLHTDSGMALEQDVEVDAHPYLRFCGAEGLRLFASVRMYKGQGEVRVVWFADAPQALPDLHRTMGDCFAGGGGLRRPPADVGPAPPVRSVERTMEAMQADLVALGYRPSGRDRNGTLRAPQRDVHPLPVAAGRCFAVVAAGDGGIADLDLFVRTSTGREVARDTSRRASARVRFCAPEGETLVAEVRAFQGGGAYGLRTFALDEPAGAGRTPGLEGFARIGYAELSARMAARGMRARPVAWGRIGPGQALRMPVTVEAGRCYAFGAVPADDAARGDLDLIVVDEDDALVAWDVGPGRLPIVWHCAERSGGLRAVGRIYGAVGNYLLIVGEER